LLGQRDILQARAPQKKFAENKLCRIFENHLEESLRYECFFVDIMKRYVQTNRSSEDQTERKGIKGA
jgi:hypothetical protein